MTDWFVPRTISFVDDRQDVSLDAATALANPLLTGRPLILLGEAGSGKSDLLRYWSDNQVTTASQLMNGYRPRAGRSYVDGLDEAAGLRDGDALDRLLGVLEAQKSTDFVIACRVADWRSASGVDTIKRWTGVEPVELTIEPLGHTEVLRFLQQRKDFSESEAEAFATHYNDRGLGDWLGNPQTLLMLAEVDAQGRRPETTGALFSQYVDLVCGEPRKQNTLLADADAEEIRDALGALFAALILGGYDALTVAPLTNRNEGDLPLAEAKKLPGLSKLTREHFIAYLDSRLIRGAGSDRLTYQHRRIGEYLGAQWLAGRATTKNLRERLLGALRHGEIVPSNLRGLWAWLAKNRELAPTVISADPLAVVEYGDADTLDAPTARILLSAIERADDEHQSFGWRHYRAEALAQAALDDEVERVLAVPGDRRFWTQFILLRQFTNAETVTRHSETLRGIMLDSSRPYGTRDAAGDALANYGMLPDWPRLIGLLANGSDRDGLRLALVLMRHSNVGLVLSDTEFAETVYAYSGLTPRFPSRREVGTIGLYYYDSTQPIPDVRLDGILDALTDCAHRYLQGEWTADAWDVKNLFFALLKRRLKLGDFDVDRLWTWLSAWSDNRYGGQRENQDWLISWLQANDTVRRALQRKVFDSCSAEPGAFSWRLHETSPGLTATVDDLIALLESLPSGSSQWRELIWLAPRADEGARARSAAERHIENDEDRAVLLEHAREWSAPINENARAWKERHEREAQERKNAFRADYLDNREKLRTGFWGALVGPAQIYMGRAYEAERALPPEDRIGAWIGEDLQVDALAGFEAFLTANPTQPPTATQIADSHADNRQWPAALILAAALAERLRTKRGFDDLPTERLQAGLFAERTAFLDDSDWETLSEALRAELERRGAWPDTARMFVSPQLRKRRTYVSWLWRVLASNAGSDLAAEWLRDFPRIAAEPEEAMVDKLLGDRSSASRDVLIEIAKRRRKQRLDDRRRLNWQAVEFILGSQPPETLTTTGVANPGLLWALRDRMAGKRRGRAAITPSPALLATIVSTFAPQWPQIDHPAGVTMGDANGWDASDFIAGCIDVLAADPTDEATVALATLTRVAEGYEWKIKRSTVDQLRLRANAEWLPLKVKALTELVTDGSPINHADLQRILIAEIDTAQAKIRSNDAGSIELFYEAGKPKLEKNCDAALVTLLRQTDHQRHGQPRLSFALQPHLSGKRAGDIWCTSGDLAVAVECKRHWHADLWSAFDWQLALQQASDWRARDHGVYIVYWFGLDVHAVTGPPRGSGINTPKSAIDLEIALRKRAADLSLAGIAVKVLDVSRP